MSDVDKKKCLYCGYERQPEDNKPFIPESKCPMCSVPYEKGEMWFDKTRKSKQFREEKEKIPREEKKREEKKREKQEQMISVEYEKYLKDKMARYAVAMSYKQFKKVYKERQEFEKSQRVEEVLKKNQEAFTDNSINRTSKPAIFIPKCPTCGSPDVKKISSVAKSTVKYVTLGVLAPLVGKTYKCNNCKFKW